METRLRELLAALSQLKWIFQAQAAFMDSIIHDNAPNNIWSIPETVNSTLDVLFNFMLDNVSTQLSNIVLMRRDLVLKQASGLRPHMITEIRSQPVLQPSLIVVDKDVVDKQTAHLERQLMVRSLTSTVLEKSHTPFRGLFRRRSKTGKAGAKSDTSSSYPNTRGRRGNRGGSGGYYQGSSTPARGGRGRGRAGRARGRGNPTTSSQSTDASQGQKQ